MKIEERIKIEYIFTSVYLLAIFVCLFLAIPMTGENSDSFFTLILLTLPWSAISLFVIFGAIHNGNGDHYAVLSFISTGFANAFLIYFFIRWLSRMDEIESLDLEGRDSVEIINSVAEGNKDNTLR